MNSIYSVDPVDNIGIGYKFKSSTGYSNELEGIDLKNGNVIWKRELNRAYGWRKWHSWVIDNWISVNHSSPHLTGKQIYLSVINVKDDPILFTSQGKALSIDNQLNYIKTTEFEDLSIYYLRTKDLKFIAKDKQTLIVNNDGKRMAEIEASSDAFLIENTLYNKLDNSFIAIDLKEIIKNE